MFFTEFSEFSDKNIVTLKGLEPATQPPLVSETSMLPQRQPDMCRGGKRGNTQPPLVSETSMLPQRQPDMCRGGKRGNMHT